MTKQLAISFSGGRTSAVMTHLLMEQHRAGNLPYEQIEITFANTGMEHPKTLEFVHACDFEFGWDVKWLEGVAGPHGTGMRHDIVNYHTCCTNGRVFAEYIAKYGIPNAGSPQCTSRLKEDVMKSYLKSVGYKFSKTHGHGHHTAIGIRADEIDRMSDEAEHLNLIYPLVKEGITKRDVNLYIQKNFPFDLEIPGDHYGNCVFCWKKSDRKIFTLILEQIHYFMFPLAMEREYSRHKAKNEEGLRFFWRRNRNTYDMIRQAFEKARDPKWEPYSDDPSLFDPELDVGSACGESCEVFSDAAN